MNIKQKFISTWVQDKNNVIKFFEVDRSNLKRLGSLIFSFFYHSSTKSWIKRLVRYKDKKH